MTDKTTVSTNVDTFNEGGDYFVRTEIEARLVTIHGPFSALETAKKLQADSRSSCRARRPPPRPARRRADGSPPSDRRREVPEHGIPPRA
jgi:hypothetical protein